MFAIKVKNQNFYLKADDSKIAWTKEEDKILTFEEREQAEQKLAAISFPNGRINFNSSVVELA